MGLFSQDCHGCSKPLLAAFNVGVINEWMQFGVSITKDGTLVSGVYDGYGSLVTDDEDEIRCVGNEFNDDGSFSGTGPTVWHAACWAASGFPKKWQGESECSADQGHFFDQGTYDIPEPQTADDVRGIRNRDANLVAAIRGVCAVQLAQPADYPFFKEDYDEWETPDEALLRLFREERPSHSSDLEAILALCHG